jgi:hypothetical protein
VTIPSSTSEQAEPRSVTFIGVASTVLPLKYQRPLRCSSRAAIGPATSTTTARICGLSRDEVLDRRHQPRDTATAGVLVVVELDVPLVVVALTGERDRRPRQVGAAFHAEREAVDRY